MITRQSFLREYQKALDAGTAAAFLGAGFSRAAGYVDWKELLKDVAEDLKLDVAQEHDLVALAQFHVNERKNRGRLNQLLVDEFTSGVALTRNHTLLSDLPLSSVWTTNYDSLLEQAFRGARKRVDVKSSERQLAYSLPGRDTVLYKMHGDVTDPASAVITKEDYELYDESRRLFSMQLQGDLISKTFLFLGFSFTDPNIDHILSRIRGLLGTNVREHFCIMKAPTKPKSKGKTRERAEFDYATRKLDLRISDLKRYGIQTLLVDDYRDITGILADLHRRAFRKNIFVSGSASEAAPFGVDKLTRFSRGLGEQIVARGYNLTSGFGLGIGGDVILGALEQIFRDPEARVDERATLRPFPQSTPTGMTQDELWKRYRADMISRTGATIFIAGNKVDSTASTVIANGCLQEFELTVEAGRVPIPIGASGHAARQVWETIAADRSRFYRTDVRRQFERLNDSTATVEELLDSAFSLLAAETST